MTRKKIEEIYKEMDEITHILERPGMWVGSVKPELKSMFLYNNDTQVMETREVTYIPAMLKVVDEVISNSCDEYRRSTNMGLNRLKVTISSDGWVEVEDNGGIPIVKHPTAGCYVPEFIFGRLRTSSNYNDDEDRNVIGTNGVGSALANVFSKKFIIESADSKNKFHRMWKDNMRTLCDDLSIEKCSDHFTSTKFWLDFSRFDTSEKTFTLEFVDIIEKRCIDAAAANLGLKVVFEYKDKENGRKSQWKFTKFDQYIDLYNGYVDIAEGIKFADDMKQVWVYPSGSINIGFVNGAECSKGTHIRAVRQEVNTKVSEHLLKKEKIEVTPRQVDNKYSMFICINVVNPAYNSQTKEELTTPVERFSRDVNYTFDVPDTFLNKICRSEIIDIVLDWYKQKAAAEDKAQIRKLNKAAGKKLLRSDKFIDCNSRKREEKQLYVYEGDSAKSGFRTARDPQTQAAYIMRGVPLNTYGMSPVQVMKNQVFSDMVNVLGLKWGEYNYKENLNFNKICIASDADQDGSKIASLLLVFFNHFPELYEQGLIVRLISPIIIATKGSEKRKYYTMKEFEKDEKKLGSGWKIKYCKGLGGLNNEETREMMRQPIFHTFTKDEMADSMLRRWFAKGIASERKDMMKKDLEA
jgi:DNA topoisomerase-2